MVEPLTNKKFRLNNREECLEEVDRLAVRNWFNQDVERMIAFSTIYGSYANRVGVSGPVLTSNSLTSRLGPLAEVLRLNLEN